MPLGGPFLYRMVIMHIKLALNNIFTILDGDDPAKHASSLRHQLEGMKRGLNRSGLDDEVIDLVNEYLETWLVDDAIEEDIDSFIEETNDVYAEVVDEDEEEDEEDEDDEDDIDDEF